MVKILPKSQQELKRHDIRTLLKANVPIDGILEVVRTSIATVRRVKKRMSVNGSTRRKPGSKGVKRLAPQDKIAICRLIRANPFRSSQDMIDLLDLTVTPRTVNRYLNQAGFTFRSPHSKLALTPAQVERRYQWCLEMEL